MYTILRSKSHGLEKPLLGFAAELIKHPSTSLEEEQVALLVEAQMRAAGFDKVFRDETGNVIGIIYGMDGGPTVLLNSHMDTVAAGEDKLWHGKPYDGRVADGKLWGVGASDCKAGLAAQIFVGTLLKRSLLPLKGNLIVAATVAEENGWSVGVRALLEKTIPDLGMKIDYAILGEPTNLGLYYGHDGWAEIEIRVEGTNRFNIDDAARSIYEEFRINGDLSRASEGIETMSVQSPYFDETTSSSEPVRAVIRVDKRLNPSEEVGEVLERVRRTASLIGQADGGVSVATQVAVKPQKLYTGRTVAVKEITHAWVTDPYDPLMTGAISSLAAAGCRAKPGKWTLGRLGMGTAGGVLVNEFKIPTIGYGPGDEDVVHKPNECVEIGKVTQAMYGTTAIVHHLIGIPVIGWSSDEI